MKYITKDRFWDNVSKNGVNGCWIWNGCKDNDGYGIYSFKGVPLRVHRETYRIKYGNIPKGLLVRHKCNNPSCCNPKHLELGTNADNMNDKAAINNYYRLVFGSRR